MNTQNVLWNVLLILMTYAFILVNNKKEKKDIYLWVKHVAIKNAKDIMYLSQNQQQSLPVLK